ncbi:MAG: hypothetical protein AAFY58_07495, partial [Planctomycetota bacterium]
SVQSPYQLLVVGDPICQPWAKRPSLDAVGLPSEDASLDPSMLGLKELGVAPPVTTDPPSDGEAGAADAAMRLRPVVGSTSGRGTPHWELYVDGRMRMRLPTEREASFTAEQLGPGWHELRCVGVADDPMEATSRRLGAITIDRPDGEPGSGTVEIAAFAEGPAVRVEASADGAERIELFHNSRRVGAIDGDGGAQRLSADDLGRGPVRLQAVTQPGGLRSRPVWVTLR